MLLLEVLEWNEVWNKLFCLWSVAVDVPLNASHMFTIYPSVYKPSHLAH